MKKDLAIGICPPEALANLCHGRGKKTILIVDLIEP